MKILLISAIVALFLTACTRTASHSGFSNADFDVISQTIAATGIRHSAFVEHSSFFVNHVGYRELHVTLRIPPESHFAVMSELFALGFVTSVEQIQSHQDFLFQRNMLNNIAELAALESTILANIASTRDVAEIISLEMQLSFVRADIASAYMWLYGDVHDNYTSVHVSVLESELAASSNYEPSTLWGRILQAFTSSINGVGAFFRGSLLFLARILVPVVVILLLFWTGLFVYRRSFRRKRRQHSNSKAHKAVRKLL